MTDIGRRRFVQGALGTTAFLALPGRLVAQPEAGAASGTLPDRYPPILEGFPRATYAVLDAASHNVSGERPALLAALLDDWLDRVERSRV